MAPAIVARIVTIQIPSVFEAPALWAIGAGVAGVIGLLIWWIVAKSGGR